MTGGVGEIVGDFVFSLGVSSTAVFLKEIDAFGKISNEAKVIAQGLKNAIEEHPSFATAERLVLKMSHEVKDVGSAKKSAHALAQPIVTEATSVKGATSVLNKELVALNVKEFAEQEIGKATSKLRILEKNIEELSRSVSHERVGELLNMSTDYTKFEKIEAETKRFYDFIRTTNEDINAIANNTGINKEILNQIKSHVFIEEHILRDGVIMRFHPHEDMAAAW